MKTNWFIRPGFLARFCLAFLLLVAIPGRADVLLQYRFESGPSGPDLPNYSDPVNGLAGGYMLDGLETSNYQLPSTLSYPTTPQFSISPSGYAVTNGATTNGFVEDVAVSLTNDCLVEFDVTVGTAVTNLALDQFTFDIARGGGNTNRAFGLYMSINGGPDEEIQGTTYILTQRYTWDPQAIDLSGFPSLQSLTAGDVITFKIPFFTASAGNSIEMDTISIVGTANGVTNQLPVQPLKITDISVVPDTSATLTWLSNEGAGAPGQNTGLLYTVEYAFGVSGPWLPMVTDIPADGYPTTTETLDLTGGGGPFDLMALQYQMGNNVIVDVVTNQVVVTNYASGPQIQDAANLVAGGVLTKGAGLNLFDPNSTIAYPTAPSLAISFVADTTNGVAALANNSVFTFNLTVGTDVTDFDAKELSLLGARGGGATPRGFRVYVTTPTTTDELVQGDTDFTTQRTTWTTNVVDLSGVASLQNLTAGQVVTVKIAGYSPVSTAGLDFDDITISADVTSPGGGANVIALQYQMGNPVITGVVTNSVVVTNYVSGPQFSDAADRAAGSVLMAGAGLNAFDVNAALGYGSAPVLSVNFDADTPDSGTALGNDSVFSFDMTVGSNVTDFDVTRLKLNEARGGGATPRGFGLYVTTPTTTDELVVSAVDANTARVIWDAKAIDLSGVTSLQNLSAGDVVTFKFACYSPAAGNSVEFDDITVYANITPPGPTAPPYVGADKLFLRVKRQ